MGQVGARDLEEAILREGPDTVAAFTVLLESRHQLEMGGKNPVVVLEDANLDRGVELTIQRALKLAGERNARSW